MLAWRFSVLYSRDGELYIKMFFITDLVMRLNFISFCVSAKAAVILSTAPPLRPLVSLVDNKERCRPQDDAVQQH